MVSVYKLNVMILWIGLLLVTLSGPAVSMQFTEVTWHGHAVLQAKGTIIAGDAAKFVKAIKSIAPLPHGFPVLLLDSAGGSVSEALKISAMLDRTPTHTVVPRGVKCASACASIVFVAGRLRTVEEGGFIGQHSCSLSGIVNEECNKIISRHAFAHGVSYGSIHAFITYISPKNILWFARDHIDCWGISRYAFETAKRL